jgi:hypothetical protein
MNRGAPGVAPPADPAFDLDLSGVRSDVLKRGYAYWRSRCGPRLPSRAMIDPTDIPALLPHIVLHGVKRDPLDFIYRLIGTEVRRHMAQDRTGQWMSAIPEQHAPSQIWTNLATIVETRRPLVNRTPYAGPHQHFVTMEDLQLPLAADGVTVDMILVFVDFVSTSARR